MSFKTRVLHASIVLSAHFGFRSGSPSRLGCIGIVFVIRLQQLLCDSIVALAKEADGIAMHLIRVLLEKSIGVVDYFASIVTERESVDALKLSTFATSNPVSFA
jgi:hypothetical protein